MGTLKWKCFCWGIPSETSMLMSFEVIFPLKKSMNNTFLHSFRRVIKNVFHEKQEKIDYFYPFQLGTVFHLFIGKWREMRFVFLLVCFSFPNILVEKDETISPTFLRNTTINLLFLDDPFGNICLCYLWQYVRFYPSSFEFFIISNNKFLSKINEK